MALFNGVGDVVASYVFLKKLTTPFNETKAYKLGIIDENGKFLKKKNELRTVEELDAVGMMDRITWNLKKILGKLPGGETKIASYAAALWLIKETRETTEEEFSQFMNENFDEISQLFMIVEEGPVNNVGSGAIAGAAGDPPGKRKKQEPHDVFASQAVFDVDPAYFHKCRDGKRKYHRYENYVGSCENGRAIREYALQNPKNAILVRDKSTGAMINLKYGSKHLQEVYSASPNDKAPIDDPNDRPMTTIELNYVEKYLDRLYASLGIDLDFSGRHFRERLRDERNGRNITKDELINMFKKVYTKWGQTLKQWGPGAEAVLADMSTDLNIPIMMKWDAKNKEIDLVAKTVLVKRNFVPNNSKEKKLTVEAQLDEYKVEVPHHSETLGIPRHQMPQIVSTEYDDYFKYLEDNGLEIKRETATVGSLKAIQNEFDTDKIEQMIAKHYQQGSNVSKIKPLIVSSDNYLIDGHHRWLAMVNVSKNIKIPIIRVKAPMGHILSLTKMYPGVRFVGITRRQTDE